MINLYTGHDQREEAGTWLFCSSVLARTSEVVKFCPLHKPVLNAAFGQKFAEGSNAFTVSRFLIPALQDFSGWALFADGADMMARGDIAELWALRDPQYAVQVVKHNYTTRHLRKYRDTLMESENKHYPRKNWASLMLINCAHPAWRGLTPDKVAAMPVLDLLQFKFLADEQIGALPAEWNHLADEYGRSEQAKLLHWTAGVPGFPAYERAPHAVEWRDALRVMNYLTP